MDPHLKYKSSQERRRRTHVAMNLAMSKINRSRDDYLTSTQYPETSNVRDYAFELHREAARDTFRLVHSSRKIARAASCYRYPPKSCRSAQIVNLFQDLRRRNFRVSNSD